MGKLFRFVAVVICAATTLLTGCKKDSNDPKPPPGNTDGGDVTITGTAPEYPFWGDEMSVTGTGFSSTTTENYVWVASSNSCGTNYMDSTDWKKVEVLSATTTKLVFKVPTITLDNDQVCGPSTAQVRVTVKGKTGISENFEVGGFIIPLGFCLWVPAGYYTQGAMYIGDSVYLELGGFGKNGLILSGNMSRVRLTVDGKAVPAVLKTTISGCSDNGIQFSLNPNSFEHLDCTVDPYWGFAARHVAFTASIQGVPQSEVSRDFIISNFPRPHVDSHTGFASMSKSGTGDRKWHVMGRNFYHGVVKFLPQLGCSGNPVIQTDTDCSEGYCDEFTFDVPVGDMSVGCSYNIVMLDYCGTPRSVGGVTITL